MTLNYKESQETLGNAKEPKSTLETLENPKKPMGTQSLKKSRFELPINKIQQQTQD